VQRAPALLLAVKRRVDTARKARASKGSNQRLRFLSTP